MYNLENQIKNIYEAEKYPEELDNKIENVISKTKPKKFYFKKVSIIALTLIFLFTISVSISPVIAKYIYNIPVLGDVIQIFYKDKGINNAKIHGYKGLLDSNNMKINDENYSIYLENIYLDETRLEFGLILTGKGINYLKNNISSQTDESSSYPITNEDILNNSICVSVFAPQFDNPGMCSLPVNEENIQVDEKGNVYLSLKFNKSLNYKELIELLNTQAENFELKLKCYGTKDSIEWEHEFQTVEIPILYSNVNKQINIKQNLSIFNNYADIYIHKLSISPASMVIGLEVDISNGFDIESFDKLKLVDNNGNIYEYINQSELDHIKYFIFSPSVYYNDIKELYLCFDDIRVKKTDNSFNLLINDSYPKKLEYMGEEIIIESISTTEDELQIEIIQPYTDKLNIGLGISLDGCSEFYADTIYNQSKDKQEKTIYTFNNIKIKNEYTLVFQNIGYSINKNGKYELNMNE